MHGGRLARICTYMGACCPLSEMHCSPPLLRLAVEYAYHKRTALFEGNTLRTLQVATECRHALKHLFMHVNA
jgi:hypothetical protein